MTLAAEGTYTSAAVSTLVTKAIALQSDSHKVFASVNYERMTNDYYALLTDAYINPILWTVNTEGVVLSMNDTVVGVLSDYINAGKVIQDYLLQ